MGSGEWEGEMGKRERGEGEGGKEGGGGPREDDGERRMGRGGELGRLIVGRGKGKGETTKMEMEMKLERGMGEIKGIRGKERWERKKWEL